MKPSELAAATPDSRDRYVDFLRVASLGTVIIGHWIMAVVVTGPEGTRVGNALAWIPALHPLTWLLQVMPVFFFVGGFSHATALRRGVSYAEFIRSRAARLLIPTAVFAASWIGVALVLHGTGRHFGLAAIATKIVAQPLWFVGVYLGVVALAPPMLALHRRYGVAVPAALAVGVVVVDVLRFGLAVPYIGYLNFALVWLAVHQMGFFYADGRISAPLARAMALCGLGGVVLLTSEGPYPVSMVGLPGDAISNMAPPTLALFAQSAGLIGLVLLLRAAGRRWLARPRVWVAVIAANGVAMTAFLWHLTAMFLAGVVLIGLPQPPVGSASWWVLRVVWISAAAVGTAMFIALFRRADRPRKLDGATPTNRRAALGVSLCLLGVLGFSVAGFGTAVSGGGGALMLVSGAALLRLRPVAAR